MLPQQLFQAQPNRNCPWPGTNSLLGGEGAHLVSCLPKAVSELKQWF